MAEAGAERVGTSSGAAVMIALCFIVAVLEGYDIQAMGLVAPRLAPELGLAPGQMGLVFSISNMGIVLGAGLGGWLMDVLGRRPVFITAVIAFGVFTLATTYAVDFNTLLIARLLTGLGFGGALPGLLAISADISAPNRRASTATMMLCGLPLGGAASALLMSNLPAEADWRLVLWIGGGLPLLVAGAITLWMRETHSKRERSESAKTSVVTALFGEGRAAPSLLIWAALLPIYVILYTILNWLPALVVAKGFDGASASQASLAFNISGAIGALIGGRLVDRFGFRWPLPIAFSVLVAALAALAVVTDFVVIVALSGLVGAMVMGGQFPLLGLASSYYPTAMHATGSGAALGGGRLGSILGPIAAGIFLGAGASNSDVLSMLAPAAAVAAIAVIGLSFFKPRGG